MQSCVDFSFYDIITHQQLTSEMFGMVADTATILIAPHAPWLCAVLWAFTAFILLTTTSRVAPRVASLTTWT